MRLALTLFSLLLGLTGCGDGGDVPVDTQPNSVQRSAQVTLFNFTEAPTPTDAAQVVDVDALVGIEAVQSLASGLGHLFGAGAPLSWSQLYVGTAVPAPESVGVSYQLLDSNSRASLAQLQSQLEHQVDYWLFASGVVQSNVTLTQFEVSQAEPHEGEVTLQLFQGDGRHEQRRLDLYIDRQLRFANQPWNSLSELLALPEAEANGQVDILVAGDTPNFDSPEGHLWHTNALGLDEGGRYLLATVNDERGTLTLLIHQY
ncbi:hypothetical protein [Ferrimonas marina]|uniref:Lipoprotein n=1 Tax=Ferrimonas marina TaxID=299255 RepID=A0A1M5YCI5_9GAMM|nr:hypothetical protein [Ferrimonas marina]SHI09594.1 hypothetical protein SAMN02745129_4068 [Ferrimonas marina]